MMYWFAIAVKKRYKAVSGAERILRSVCSLFHRLLRRNEDGKAKYLP